MKLPIAVPLALSLLAACGGAPATDPASDAPAAGPVDLPKLGLKADAPAGAEVKDAMVGEGHMVHAPGLVVNVELAPDSRPKTGEEAQKDVDMYGPKNPRVESLADGWALTFDNEGTMGKNFFVHVRRELDGKSIWCETTAAEAVQQANALAFCKSLRK